MIKYNTQEKNLKLPEYGRHIQKMIDFCKGIEGREERNLCARKIASLIAVLFASDTPEKERMEKIWDHINLMAEFDLDIDFPVEVKTAEEMHPKPEKIPYQNAFNSFRHYGRNIQKMVHLVADMENGIEKDRMIFLVANQMKKLLVSQNPEIATDLRVFNDIKEISRGKIAINPENYRLNDYIGVASASEAGKKKKKK